MSPGTHKRLLDDLQRRWKEQAEAARQGRLSQVEKLGEQSGRIAEEAARRGILCSAEYAEQRERLRGLYEDLRLTLSDQRDKIGQELDTIRKYRKTIGTYRHSIQMAEQRMPGKIR